MSAWIVYSKDGATERCELRSVEYGGTHMGERAVTATFVSPIEVEFGVFDYIEYRGEKFELEAVPTVKKTSSFEYTYELRFVSLKYELERCEMRDLVPYDNEVVYPTPLTFSFTGNVRYLTERIQACLDALYGSGVWTITIADGVESEEKNISISQQNCWNALALVNTEYGLNFYIKGRTITIGGDQPLVSHVFEYGKGNGLYEIERAADTDTGIVTKLRAFGSDRNLDYSYPKKPEWSDSVLPVSFAFSPLRLMLPSFKTDGKTDYILADSATISKYGIREASIIYDDIYPTISGATNDNGESIDEIKAVDAVDDESGTFVVYLYDLGFDLEEHLTTSEAQISMKSGAMQGYTFSMAKIEKQYETVSTLAATEDTGDTSEELEDGETSEEETGTFVGYKITLNRISAEGGENYNIPNSDWGMAAGDKFVLLNILMPQTYIREAENRLKARAEEYLAQYGKTNFSYNIGLHDKFLIENPTVYDALIEGAKLSVYDEELGISEEVTIQSITITENMEDNILPQVKVTLNNEPSASTLERIQGQIDSLANETAGNSFSTQSEIMAQYRKKLDKPFFDKLFVAVDAKGNDIASNDVTTPVAYIKAKYDFAVVGGVTSYVTGSDLDLPSIYDGLPLDNSTIYWEETKDEEGNVTGKVLKAKVTSEDGTIAATLLGDLTNVGSWANAIATEDRIMVQKKDSTSWEALSLSEISASFENVKESGEGNAYTSMELSEDKKTLTLKKNETFAKQSDYEALNTKVTDFLEGAEDTDEIINKWKELEAFLDGMKETDDLATVLGNKADKATTLAGYGITDAYTKDEVSTELKKYVTLEGEETISGNKTFAGSNNFTGSLMVNGTPIVYDSENKYWKLEGDLLVTGGVTSYSSDTAFTPSTVTDAVEVDGTTIIKDEDGRLAINPDIDLGGGGIENVYALTIKNSAGTSVLSYDPSSSAASLTLTKAMVGLGNVENTALSTWTGSTNITTLGTITSGTWKGSAIANAYLANSAITINGTSTSLGGSVNLYIGTTKAQTSSATQNLTGIGYINSSVKFSYDGDDTNTVRFQTGHTVVFGGVANYANQVYYFRPMYGSGSETTASLYIQKASASASDPTYTNLHYFNHLGHAYHQRSLTVGTTITAGGAVLPSTTESYAIGSSSLLWSNLYTKKATIDGISLYQSQDGVLYLDGNLVVAGGVTSYGDTSVTSSSIMDAIAVDGTTIMNDGTKLYINPDIDLGGGASTWDELEGKPTTIAGYGITDAYTKTQTDSKYVTALGTNGNYLTYTINGTANNLTVPYATTAKQLSAWKVLAITKDVDAATRFKLIADLTNWTSSYNGQWGIIGMMYGQRGGNLAGTCVQKMVAYCAAYKLSDGSGGTTYELKTDVTSYVKPYIVTYNGTRYLALRITGSGSVRVHSFIGYTENLLSEFIEVGVDDVTIDYETEVMEMGGANAASATQLKTARTIWGQSFDGTANVTGALSGVTDITMSGGLTLMAGDPHNTDQWISFKYSSTDLDKYSWRLGYLGTGSGDANYLAFQSNGSGAWVDVLRLGLTSYLATFAGGISATSGEFSGNVSMGSATINGGNLVYDSENKYWKLTGDLIVTGGVTSYANEGTYTPSTIMDAIQVDGSTISKANGYLEVIGGTGGGLDESELATYLTNNTFVNKVTTSGSGNAVTAASISGNTLTLTKGATYLTTTTGDARYVTAIGTSGNYLTYTKNGSTSNVTVPYATTANELGAYKPKTFSKSNNGGYPCYLLIADVTSWYGVSSDASSYGITGFMFGYRGGATPSVTVEVSAMCAYGKGYYSLATSNSSYIVPRVVSYNSKYYLALYMKGANRAYSFIGKVSNLLDSFTELLCTSSGTYSGLSVVYDGSVTGTAATAAKLGTSTLGSTTKPIYLSSGTATECSTYAGGTAVTLNGSSKAASTASFYAPTSAGTSGYVLTSSGSGAPSWTAQSSLSVGSATKDGSGNTITSTYLKLAGGTMSGHLYMGGVSSSSSTDNKSQIVLGTSSSEYVALSAVDNKFIINPTTSTTTGQVILGVNGATTSFTSSGGVSISGPLNTGSTITTGGNILPSTTASYTLGSYDKAYTWLDVNCISSGATSNNLWLCGGTLTGIGVVIARSGSNTATGELCRFTDKGMVWASGVVGRIATTGQELQFKYNGADATSLLLNSTAFKPFISATSKLMLGRYDSLWNGLYLGTSTSSACNLQGVNFCDTSGYGVGKLSSSATNLGLYSVGSLYLRGGCTKGESGAMTASSTGVIIDSSGNMLVTGGVSISGALTVSNNSSSYRHTASDFTFGAKYSAALSSAGWYRFATSNVATNAGGTYIFHIRRNYYNTSNESYIIAATINQGGCKFTQLAGHHVKQLITKIRCTYDLNSTMYFDLYYSGTVSNTIYVNCTGNCTLQSPASTSSALAYTETFDLADGFKSAGDMYVTGNLLVSGGVTSYATTEDSGAAFDFLPDEDATYNLGSTSKRWNEVYATKLVAYGYNSTERRMEITNAGSMIHYIPASGAWAGGYVVKDTSGNTITSAVGAYGSGSSLTYIYFGGTYTSPQMVLKSGTLGIGTSSPTTSYKLHVAGNAYTTGTLTQASDIRFKEIHKEVSLSLATMAEAPSIEYHFMDDAEKVAHVGTSAQYWQSVNGVVREDDDGKLGMDYPSLGVVMGISLAKELSRYEDSTDKRIQKLERENEELRKEIETLKNK